MASGSAMIAAVYHAPGDVRVEDMPRAPAIPAARTSSSRSRARRSAAPMRRSSGTLRSSSRSPRPTRSAGTRGRRSWATSSPGRVVALRPGGRGSPHRRPRRVRGRRVLRRVRVVPAGPDEPVRALLHARSAQPRRARAVREHAGIALPARARDVLGRCGRDGAAARRGAARAATERRRRRGSRWP